MYFVCSWKSKNPWQSKPHLQNNERGKESQFRWVEMELVEILLPLSELEYLLYMRDHFSLNGLKWN
jgi:hypothetical protein